MTAAPYFFLVNDLYNSITKYRVFTIKIYTLFRLKTITKIFIIVHLSRLRFVLIHIQSQQRSNQFNRPKIKQRLYKHSLDERGMKRINFIYVQTIIFNHPIDTAL